MYAKGKSQKMRIVAAADKLFQERGFVGTSFSDLARKSGVARGNFYHYFRTKECILKAVFELRSARVAERLAFWETESETPFERLKACVKEAVCDRPALMFQAAMAGGDEGRQYDGGSNLLRLWLTRQLGLLGAKDAGAATLRLMAWMAGAERMAAIFADPNLLQSERKEMERWLEEIRQSRHRERQVTRSRQKIRPQEGFEHGASRAHSHAHRSPR